MGGSVVILTKRFAASCIEGGLGFESVTEQGCRTYVLMPHYHC